MTSPDDIRILHAQTIDGYTYNMNCLKVHTSTTTISIAQSGWVQGYIDLPFNNGLAVVGYRLSGTYASFATVADMEMYGTDKNQVRYMIRNQSASSGTRTWTLEVQVLYYDASIYTVANTYTNTTPYSQGIYGKNYEMGGESAETLQLRVYEGSQSLTWSSSYYEALLSLPMECPLGIIGRQFNTNYVDFGIYCLKTETDANGAHLRLGVRRYDGGTGSFPLKYYVLYLAHPYDTNNIFTS